MAKLNQILAIEKAARRNATDTTTAIYHLVQKPALLSGISRVYQPLDDEDIERLPSESTKVQVKAEDLLEDVRKTLGDMWDVVATKEWANTEASADITIGATKVAEAVPVSYLLFLEKQLTDLHTIVVKIPQLDPAYSWTKDDASDVYKSQAIETTRSKKIQKPLTLAPATDKHPAQVQLVVEDKVAGTWTTVHFSGALPASRINELVDRIEKLQRAVKFAREEANSRPVQDRTDGQKILDFIFA